MYVHICNLAYLEVEKCNHTNGSKRVLLFTFFFLLLFDTSLLLNNPFHSVKNTLLVCELVTATKLQIRDYESILQIQIENGVIIKQRDGIYNGGFFFFIIFFLFSFLI